MQIQVDARLDGDLYICITKPYPRANDLFTSCMFGFIPRGYHYLCGHCRISKRGVINEEPSLVSYSDSAVDKASRITTGIITSVIPVLAIYILNLLIGWDYELA